MSNKHITIQTCLKALGCTSYHDICSAYLTARLIIVYSKNDDCLFYELLKN